EIQRALGALPLGVNIGNPTMGTIHPDLMAFDWVRADDSVFVYTVSLELNELVLLASNGLSLASPTFSPNDQAVIVQYDGGAGLDLWYSRYDPETNTGIGGFELLVTDASLPNWRFEGRDQPTDVTVEHDQSVVPETYTLHQNYPNPFNASTVITFETAKWGDASLDIYNVLGQTVSSWSEVDVPPGKHTVTWDGRDDAGNPVASGVYIYRVTAGEQSESRKMVLVK
ncbi:MAG: T9SS type A sorting domain-containing protein, partial [candidate division Zixibacteria bacterium]|nr:T9SS type A sorting domain-containing protein [candidate division Zixibacteria bacterium]